MSSNVARAVAYIRVSDDAALSDDDAGNVAHSAAAQRDAIEAWASRRRVVVASWQVDRGVGGAVPIAERPGLVAAYAAVREHGAGVLVAASAERFAHDSLVAWLIERAALTEGAAIHTADGTVRSPAEEADAEEEAVGAAGDGGHRGHHAVFELVELRAEETFASVERSSSHGRGPESCMVCFMKLSAWLATHFPPN